MRFIILLLLSSTCFGQLENKTLETECNAVIEDLASQLSGKQATYLSSNGEYFQGAPTSTIVPKDGEKVTTNKDAKPSNKESWTEAEVTLPDSMPCVIAVDYYNGPLGKGYVISGIVVDNKIKYHRAINVGPESHRGHDWRVTKDKPL